MHFDIEDSFNIGVVMFCNRLERSDRTCQICKKNVIEDEFHFVIECDKYKDIRCIYIPRYFTHRPNMLKFFDSKKRTVFCILTSCLSLSCFVN